MILIVLEVPVDSPLSSFSGQCLKLGDVIDILERNKEKVLAGQKDWRERNKEKVLAAKKDWYERNKEKVLAAKKDWRERNKEKVLAGQKDWYEPCAVDLRGNR